MGDALVQGGRAVIARRKQRLPAHPPARPHDDACPPLHAHWQRAGAKPPRTPCRHGHAPCERLPSAGHAHAAGEHASGNGLPLAHWQPRMEKPPWSREPARYGAPMPPVMAADAQPSMSSPSTLCCRREGRWEGGRAGRCVVRLDRATQAGRAQAAATLDVIAHASRHARRSPGNTGLPHNARRRVKGSGEYNVRV